MPSLIQRVNSAGITYCEQDWSWDTSRRPPRDFDLWAVFGGQGTLYTDDRSWPLLPGDCFVLRPGGLYIGTHDPDRPLIVIHIHFDPTIGRDFGFHRRLVDQSFVRELLTRSVFSFRDDDPDSAIIWLEAALSEILNQERLTLDHGIDEGHAEKINNICRQIYENPSAAYRVEKLAMTVGISPDHFTRLFKQLRGTTPRKFILQARIESAQDLLRSSNHSVGRIAEILGYSDVYFFSRQFKEKVGVSPSKFRR
ncbi:AraC family transcriptional regulator [bacterium]|nr:AraC family transcriptional regulator [bacterium]